MPYAPTKTWASGDTLTAADLQSNLDGFKKFNHNITPTSMYSLQWVDTKHIMPGVIDAQTNITNNCSGIFGGQQHSYQSLNYTFVTRWNTTRGSNTDSYIIVPETSFTLEMRRPANVFFQYWMTTKSRTDGYLNGYSFIQPFHDNPKTASATSTHSHPSKVMEQVAAAPTGGGAAFATGVYISGVKYISGFSMYEGTKSVPFHIGVKGKSDNGQCEILSWGISAEVFYI